MRVAGCLLLVGALLCLPWLGRPSDPDETSAKSSNAIVQHDQPLISRLSARQAGSLPHEAPADRAGQMVTGNVVPAWQPPAWASTTHTTRRKFDHDPQAEFHSHGHDICHSGCAASHHPTSALADDEFLRLIGECARGPLDESNFALESLLYYGAQSRERLSRLKTKWLPAEHRTFLDTQLRFTHVAISLRVIDLEGTCRASVGNVRVPLDRRHVIKLQSDQLESLVASGTVKRVGLNHLWTRW